MTVIHSLSNNQFQPIGHIRADHEISRFFIHCGDELVRVCSAAGGHDARAAATDLVALVLSDTGPAEVVEDLLIVVRDMLRDASVSPANASAYRRPDLDAAVRWMGARLDDLIAELSEADARMLRPTRQCR